MRGRADLSLNRRRGALIGWLSVTRWVPPSSSWRRARLSRYQDYRGGGPHGLTPGEWTDDTSMALALADSIAERGWDLRIRPSVISRGGGPAAYSVTGRCFDIGVTTAASLRRFAETRDARTSGDDSPRASGNGSIMRLAPVPVAYVHLFPDRHDQLLLRLTESSIPTHASPQCISASRTWESFSADCCTGFRATTCSLPDSYERT
jgi:ADP-ribosylglycohydrolase